MSERRPATTIGELDIHLGNVMQKLDDFQGEVRGALAKLATRDYVDDQIRAVRKEVNESKPSTLFGNFVKVLAGVMVIASFLGLVYEVSTTLSAVRNSLPAAK